MGPVDETKVPTARKARQAFIDAMDNWDEPAADAAVAGLARTAGANELFELFCRYGSRDFRDIGHKAIFVANSWRTLECIGWQNAEPVLRSLAYALLRRWGDVEPMLPRFDELAAKGAPLLGAFAAALREEIAAARGGPAPTHRDLRALGYLGFSTLLSYQPPRVTVAS